MSSRVPPPPPRLADVPAGMKDPVAADYARKMKESVSRELISRPRATEPRHEMLLSSPSGKVFSIRVSDAGVVSATEVVS